MAWTYNAAFTSDEQPGRTTMLEGQSSATPMVNVLGAAIAEATLLGAAADYTLDVLIPRSKRKFARRDQVDVSRAALPDWRWISEKHHKINFHINGRPSGVYSRYPIPVRPTKHTVRCAVRRFLTCNPQCAHFHLQLAPLPPLPRLLLLLLRPAVLALRRLLPQALLLLLRPAVLALRQSLPPALLLLLRPAVLALRALLPPPGLVLVLLQAMQVAWPLRLRAASAHLGVRLMMLFCRITVMLLSTALVRAWWPLFTLLSPRPSWRATLTCC